MVTIANMQKRASSIQFPNKRKAMTETINALRSNPDLAAEYRHRAKAYYEKYLSPTAVMKRILDFSEE